jgi:hypothetical protein
MKHKCIRKSVVLVILAFLGLGIGAASSFAQGPPVPVADTFTIEGICDFPILVQTSGKEGSIELPNGNLIGTAPGEYWTLTNLDDPSKSETVNLTGAFHYTFHENGDVTLVGTGRNLFGFVEDHSLVIAMGTFSFTVDQDGNLIQPLTGQGRVIDVCSQLG